ncbi:bifunctional DNA primase/helicase [Pseudomonas protegens]|uniref:toprim domain-containing protein n=1 Tax=Pseudomonas protegens TaxID=380021 RepID=UPI00080701C5|nr:toprim domain-containing protein [Pseudomonas protegens]OBZ19670.1 toprim domain protein [Pseudomonas protegens]OBZ22469.1 toprim domain protein [Pseudomonas protegens]OKK41286.1 bifunctional DNA primase/helicase [Pseudomonas protegens]OKK43359.1 bifunctional DNA primase/helicase [Pseudomonas protegens]OKK55383.1 bifunctional DNA primase/helicase [Pseudomonas protegens]
MTTMKDNIREKVIERLQFDFDLKVRAGTNYMRGGTCPKCKKKELYARHDNPWQIRCGRPERCGHIEHVKDLYEDLFEDWSKRAPATDNDPTVTARAYLEFARGFDVGSMVGWFTQENYVNHESGESSATIRFPLPNDGYWERLIDRPARFGKMKARFKPKYSALGYWWKPPTLDLKSVDELWIVEGVFDAVALVQNGISAVSAMTCTSYPAHALEQLIEQRKGNLPRLVWALDNEPSARGYLQRWVKQARELGFTCSAALIPQHDRRKVDWNDLHQRWAFEEGDKRKQRRERDLEIARHEGDLLLASSAREKAILMYTWEDSTSEFHFEYANRMYWAKFDLSKLEDEQRALLNSEDHDDQLLNDRQARNKVLESVCALKLIANCNFEALYKQVNDVTGDAWFYFQVDTPNDNAPEKLTFTPKQISSSSEFKARLMFAGATWLGTQKYLDQIVIRQTEGLKTVETIDYIGYSKEHKAYIFNDIAVQGGNVYKANDEDYFEFGQTRVKCLMKSIKIAMAPAAKGYRDDWLPNLWLCFGEKGLVALTYWFGSLFAEQIREDYESFPFLEMSGEPDSGKTTLIKFLWKLFGRLYEGFDPAKGSISGRSRAMGQVSNIPLVLLEADRNTDAENAKSFEWDEFKDYYGGGLLRTRGVKNNSNDTYEPPFRASIVIAQNAGVSGHEAILSRIVKTYFAKPNITEASRAAADNLVQTEVNEVSHFIVKAMMAEPKVMTRFSEFYPKYRAELWSSKKLSSDRIIRNHSMLLALVDCLGLVLQVPEHMVTATRKYVIGMANERQAAITTDPQELNDFWQVFDYLESLPGAPLVNHSKNPGVIAINLNQFAEVAAEHRQRIPDLATLRRLLKDGRTHKLIEASKPTESAIRANLQARTPLQPVPQSVRCWHFKA